MPLSACLWFGPVVPVSVRNELCDDEMSTHCLESLGLGASGGESLRHLGHHVVGAGDGPRPSTQCACRCCVIRLSVFLIRLKARPKVASNFHVVSRSVSATCTKGVQQAEWIICRNKNSPWQLSSAVRSSEQQRDHRMGLEVAEQPGRC